LQRLDWKIVYPHRTAYEVLTQALIYGPETIAEDIHEVLGDQIDLPAVTAAVLAAVENECADQVHGNPCWFPVG
jgi:hypothetical protein